MGGMSMRSLTAAGFLLIVCMGACSPGIKAKSGSLYFDLRRYFNNDGISSNENRFDGNFDVTDNTYGSTYPAEELPPGNSIIPVSGTGGLLVVFPSKRDGDVNNISCEKQILEGFSHQPFTAIYFVGAGTNGDQDGVFKFRYLDGTIEEKSLVFHDWCSGGGDLEQLVIFSSDHRHNYKGEDEQVPCGLFALKIETDPDKTLVAIQLPDNRDIHIFAVSGMVNIR